MIDAVIFDLDGLLVDSEPVWFQARVDLLERHGKTWTHDEQVEMMGVDTGTWVEHVHARLDGTLDRDEVLHAVLDHMAGAYASGDVPLLPGARQALDHCVERYRVALASGSPRRLIEAALAGAGWTECFEEILSSDEVDEGKPAPDVYLETMRRMGLVAGRTVVVEDSGGGIRAGKAAGARVVAVPNTHLMPSAEALEQADVRLDSLHGLPDALGRLT